jgi:hypothetical protein
MTAESEDRARPSRFWRLFFRIAYRLLRVIDPALRVWWRSRLPGLRGVIDLEVQGRRSGRSRRTLLTELSVDDASYVGHPNGSCGWTRNVDADGLVVVHRRVRTDHRRLSVDRHRAVRLHAGPERERVIAATWSQQPFPANVIYWLARDHLRGVGVYYRLAGQDAA